MARRPRPHLRRALTAVEVLAHRLGTRPSLGRARFLGQGSHRRAWRVPVDLHGDEQWADWVAQVPDQPGGADERRFRKEMALLKGLSARSLPFGIPKAVDRVQVDDVTVTVTHYCPGAPVAAGLLPATEAAGLLGTLAAQVHQLSPAGLVFPNTAHATARADAEQGLAELLEIREAAPTLVDEVLAWCHDHLPPPGAPAVLTHGDLLGQNVLHHATHPPSIVDWELAGTGDPAADLAVITRGRRRPLRDAAARGRLLDAYNAHAPRPLTHERIVLHELCMVADEVAWAREAGHADQARDTLHQLRNVWRRGRRAPPPRQRRQEPSPAL